MSNKIISYSFFTPKNLYQHRSWDKYNKWDRYWYNIPALMVTNKILYPEFDINIQLSSDIKESTHFPILEKLRDNFDINLIFNDTPYSNTEPTVWRFKPLFDKSNDIVLCRDIDSLPTKNEYLATRHFIDSEAAVHTMRTHTNHTSSVTIILAGLCGFRPDRLPINIDYVSYYKQVSSQGWGVDQNSLIDMFAKNPLWTSTNFLDSRLSSKEHSVRKPLIKCISHDENFYIDNVKFDTKLNELLNLIDIYTSWSGEPTDIRKDKLANLLKLDYPEIKVLNEILNSDLKIKEFYL